VFNLRPRRHRAIDPIHAFAYIRASIFTARFAGRACF